MTVAAARDARTHEERAGFVPRVLAVPALIGLALLVLTIAALFVAVWLRERRGNRSREERKDP